MSNTFDRESVIRLKAIQTELKRICEMSRCDNRDTQTLFLCRLEIEKVIKWNPSDKSKKK